MKNDAGKDDIIRFIYDEMTPEEAGETEIRLHIDSDFKESHDDFREVQQELDKLRCSPSDALLQSIMRYADKSKPADQRAVSK
jgi:hypothetical protein